MNCSQTWLSNPEWISRQTNTGNNDFGGPFVALLYYYYANLAGIGELQEIKKKKNQENSSSSSQVAKCSYMHIVQTYVYWG